MLDNPDLLDQQCALLRDSVTDAVRARIGVVGPGDHKLRDRLRTYERTAWEIGGVEQTLQVIASGRRLLGDMTDLRPPARARWTT